MRTKTEVLQEINEMQIIKRALNHFLASYDATLMPECEAVAIENKKTVSESLMCLYEELSIINDNKKESTQQPNVTRRKHQPSKVENEGIKLFYTDRRYSLTE